MAIYAKVEKPKQQFVREIWCSRCWTNENHTIFYMSDSCTNNSIHVRFHRKCDRCGTKDTQELPLNDWNALVKGGFQ